MHSLPFDAESISKMFLIINVKIYFLFNSLVNVKTLKISSSTIKIWGHLTGGGSKSIDFLGSNRNAYPSSTSYDYPAFSFTL